MLPRVRLNALSTSSAPNSSPVTALRNIDNEQERDWEPDKSRSCRIRWNCKWDLYLAILSFTLDSASWIRLITSLVDHGGAAYLVARIISILLVGMPLLFFETAIGQLSGMGPFTFFRSLRPVFTGIGIFLMISSVYKSVSNAALSLWPLSKIVLLVIGDNFDSFNDANFKVDWDLGQRFTHLDALSVLSLSVVWILVVLVVICGLKVLKKISYLTLVVSVALLFTVMVKAIYTNPGKVYLGLAAVLNPNWKTLLSIPLWSQAIIDTLLSFNLGYGVITFISSLNPKKVNCLRLSFTIVMLHTVTLGVLLVLTSSTNSVSRVMKLNQTSEITLEEISRIDHGISHVWRIIFYTALFLLNINGLIFIGNMLASCFSNLRWRPVLAVLVGTMLYIVSLPLATAAQKVYINCVDTFTISHVPIMGLMLMIGATMGSLRATSIVDFIEFAAKIKLSFRSQSYVFVEYNAVLPLLLLMCSIDGLVRMVIAENMTSAMSITGQLLLCLPWTMVILTPVGLFAYCSRRLPHSERWKEIFKVSEYEEWLYCREQQTDQNSIYELPERISNNQAISSYYSSATILASDSVTYSRC